MEYLIYRAIAGFVQKTLREFSSQFCHVNNFRCSQNDIEKFTSEVLTFAKEISPIVQHCIAYPVFEPQCLGLKKLNHCNRTYKRRELHDDGAGRIG